MAIFARRVLQGLIDDLNGHVPARQLRNKVACLNRGERDSLAVEWELALLFAFSQAAPVKHEPAGPGSRRVDILVLDSASSGPALAMDVTTVSDRGILAANPVDEFIDLLAKSIHEGRLPASKFSWNIHEVGRYPQHGRNPKLALAPKFQLPRLFEAHVVPFLQQIKAAPDEKARFQAPPELGDFEISYDPTSEFFHGSYIGFRTPRTTRNNPLYNALDEKASQLKDAGWNVPSGVIVCDGGCQLLSDNHARARAIRSAFDLHPHLAYVVLVTVADKPERRSPSTRRVRYHAIAADSYRRFETDVQPILDAAINHMPPILCTPEEGLSQLRRPLRRRRSHYPRFHLKDNRMRFSARVLHEVLAGQRPVEEFLRDHLLRRSDGGPRDQHPIEAYLEAGYSISRAELIRSDGEDDDWIELEFAPDPAVSDLIVRARARNT